MREAEAFDRRSRRTLLLGSTTLQRCREAVDGWVAAGYGLTVVPRLDLLEGRASVATWVQAICDTLEEMVRNRHAVVAVRSEGDRALDAVLDELARRGVALTVQPCDASPKA